MPTNNAARQLPSGATASQRGFTLIELSVVLVIIGLIIGAVAIGKDVQRSAVYQRISSDYVQGWAMAYDRYYDGTGHPPGDSASAPTGMVNGASNSPLCGLALVNAMQAAGVEMPAGRAEGSANLYAYLDSNGNPQQLEVCFSNVSWSEPGATSGSYTSYTRNVMWLQNVTPALANMIDNSFDSLVDARFGKFREVSQANNTSAGVVGVPWSKDERWAYSDATAPSEAMDESQVGLEFAYLKMSR